MNREGLGLPSSPMSDLDHLDTAIAALQTELNRLDRRNAQRHGVGSMEDLQVLRLLLAHGPQRVGEIAALRAASKATVSARLDRLEGRGLVDRSRIPGDRRAVVCALTKEGRRVAAASRRSRRRLLADHADAVTSAAVEGLVVALRADDGSPVGP